VRPTEASIRGAQAAATLDGTADGAPSRAAARRRLDGSDNLAGLAAALAGVADPAVRFEVALAVESLPAVERAVVLAKVASTEPVDPWINRAVVCVAGEAAPEVIRLIVAGRSDRSPHRHMIRTLAEACGRMESGEGALSQVVESADIDAGGKLAIVGGWLHGRRALGGGDRPERFGGKSLDAWLESAREIAAGGTFEEREDALALLAVDPSVAATAILLDRLASAAGVVEARIILRGLQGRDPVAVGGGVLDCWPAASPAVRRAMLEAFFRPEGLSERLPLFQSAVESGAITPGDIAPDARHAILASDFLAPADRSRLEMLLGGAANADRAAVVAAVEGAMPIVGDRERGRQLFTRHCAGCHRAGGIGARVGPELAAMHGKPRGQMLEDILDPNRRLTGEYAAVTVVTTDGEAFTGLVSGETPLSVQLTLPEGRVEMISRNAIEVLRGTGKSLMPEGFEQTLSAAEFADLIEFLIHTP